MGSTDVEDLMSLPGLRSQLSCSTGERRYGGYRCAIENPREHFLHTRAVELEELRSRKTTALRVQLVNDWLRTASETARLVNRIREDAGTDTLNLDHLRAWRCVLTRVATPVAVAGR